MLLIITSTGNEFLRTSFLEMLTWMTLNDLEPSK